MSDQYTPTTEEVREAYADAHCPDLYVVHGDSCPAAPEFERWLATVKAEAWEQGFENAHAAHHRENVRLNRRSPAIAITNPYRKETT